jgi:hypothetical protein
MLKQGEVLKRSDASVEQKIVMLKQGGVLKRSDASVEQKIDP